MTRSFSGQGFGLYSQIIQRRLQCRLPARHFFARRFSLDVYWLSYQRDRASEWQRHLQTAPAWELDEVAHGDVKRKDGLACMPRERHSARLRHVCRPPRAVNRERYAHTDIQTLSHLNKRPTSTSSCGT